jgi:hypothetical protein
MTFVQRNKTNNIVIPAKAGIQYYYWFPGYTLRGTPLAFVT